jgi:hypothetical protein
MNFPDHFRELKNIRKYMLVVYNVKLFTTVCTRVADPRHFNSDPYLTFYFNVDPDAAPASHQSDEIL